MEINLSLHPINHQDWFNKPNKYHQQKAVQSKLSGIWSKFELLLTNVLLVGIS